MQSARVSRPCSAMATRAEAEIEPRKSAVRISPAVSSETPRSSAMNGSAGPNAAAYSPTQNIAMYAAACSRR